MRWEGEYLKYLDNEASISIYLSIAKAVLQANIQNYTNYLCVPLNYVAIMKIVPKNIVVTLIPSTGDGLTPKLNAKYALATRRIGPETPDIFHYSSHYTR